MLLSHRLLLPSGECPHPCVRSPASLAGTAGRSLLPALFVFCLTSLNASLFFPQRDSACQGQQSLQWETLPAAGCYKEPYNKQKRSQEPTPATGGNPAPFWGELPYPMGHGNRCHSSSRHSTAPTASRRSLLVFSPATSLVAAHPEGQGKGVMWGLGQRPFVPGHRAICLTPREEARSQRVGLTNHRLEPLSRYKQEMAQF